jgi:hypothetical protein
MRVNSRSSKSKLPALRSNSQVPLSNTNRLKREVPVEDECDPQQELLLKDQRRRLKCFYLYTF